MLNNKNKIDIEGKIRTIKIKGFYLVFIGIVFIMLFVLFMTISSITSLINISELNVKSFFENVCIFIISLVLNICFINGLLFSFKKIIICEEYLVIKNEKIYYTDIEKIGIRERYHVTYTKLLGKEIGRCSQKNNYLKIKLKNKKYYSEYIIGQYSIKNIRKLIKHIEEKSHCETTNSYEILDKDQEDIKKANKILFCILIIGLIVFVVIPHIYYVEEYNRRKNVAINIEENSLYDKL